MVTPYLRARKRGQEDLMKQVIKVIDKVYKDWNDYKGHHDWRIELKQKLKELEV